MKVVVKYSKTFEVSEAINGYADVEAYVAGLGADEVQSVTITAA